MVPRAGLEPARPYEHYALNVACLPISAPRLGVYCGEPHDDILKYMLAGAEGFEPPTAGFGDQCSSQTELRSCERRTFGLKYTGHPFSAALNHTLRSADRTNGGLMIF